jgi:cytochrome oxidase assembly protein ShyY1
VYRFLTTPRWLGLAALMLAMAAVMVLLGNWQLDRYRQRTAINDRIDAAAVVAPVPLAAVSAPGRAPSADVAWTRVTATGRYDPAHEVLARGRTLDGRVGFEVLTPLVLDDGSTVLVDRGWVPAAARGGADADPTVPPAPAGEVTVVGVVHRPQRGAGAPTRRGARLEVRAIDPARLAAALPYPVHGVYIAVQSPGQDGLTPVPPRRENALQNGGYALQWWLFAALTLVGYGYLAHREARRRTTEPVG